MAELDALAHGLAIVRELTPRTSDYVASRGERLSARIVAAALTKAGRRAQFVDGPDVIRTNGQFGGACPDLRLPRAAGGFRRVLGKRAREARDAGRVLRYVASVTRRRVEVGLQAVESTSPFAELNGTDNQVAFTTMRYQTNPLVITGPGAGPALTAAGVLNDILALAAS